MNLTALLLATLVVLPAAALVTWVWFAMAQSETDLRNSVGFEAQWR
jgi:hypothetical protein